MRIASIDCGAGPTVGIDDGVGRVIDLVHLGSDAPTNLRELLERGPQALVEVEAQSRAITERVAPGDFKFLPLVGQPQAIWCAALNYRTHITEGDWESPDYPPLFLRIAESICAHDEPMVQPTVSGQLDYEGELAVVIGTRARHVAPEDAYEIIAGYSCFNDGSVRDWQRHTKQIANGKNFAKTGGFGPWLTTRDEVPDIESARLTTRLNGKTMQSAQINEMVFGIRALISYITTMCELVPGDVVVTGTPGGVGARQDPQRFMLPGDVVEVEVEGVGLLRNAIVAESAVLV